MDRSEQLLSVIGRMYELVSAPAAECSWLGLIRDLPGAEHAMISQPSGAGRFWSCDRVPHAMWPTINQFNSDPLYVGVAEHLPSMRVSRMWEFLPVDALRRTPMYEQVFRPMHGGVAAMFTWREAGELFVVNVCRDAERRATFSDPEVALLENTLPHLRNAMRIRDQLARSVQMRLEAHDALEAINAGVLVLDAMGRIRFANRAVRTIIADGDTLRVEDSRLQAVDRTSDVHLQTMLRAAATIPLGGWRHPRRRSCTSPGPGPSRMVIERMSPRRPLCLTALPATRMLSGDDVSEGSVVLLVDDPDREVAARTRSLAAAHGLTSRESDVVCGLVRGLSLDAVAATLGITLGTARQYLKSVFAKTGVHRQAELVERVLRT